VTQSPRVSFVVPCYNYDRYLPDCLTSILSQQGEQDFEIIAIDDGSTDNSRAVLEAVKDSRMRIVVHPRNLGHVATVNEGFRLARGRYIARIDPDDRYRSCFLATTLPLLDRHAEVGLVYGDAAIIDAQGRITQETSDSVHSGRDFKGNLFLHLLEANSICAPTAIARREAWLKALPVPEGLAFNDWYFNIMMARHFEFYFVARVLADYRLHSSNHHSKVVLDKTEEASIFSLLYGIFGEVEASEALEREKRRARRRIYGRHYMTLADKYFGMQMNDDARRCYLAAARYRPSYVLTAGLQRRLAATVFGRGRYEWGKGLLKAVLSRN
jgi:glycosyltransferase involved in cell wall biosynthesis